ncbi:MAG: Lipoyl synthase [Chlamydiales bacterium]|nr:Lipoyl synthase [Chlamydiales bacterium]MCH9619638.1 Lipoyl synthase [Chlamydiales bacterium]MCH9623244.1 Lipoyl synthase [Chlamydiales bacterium]
MGECKSKKRLNVLPENPDKQEQSGVGLGRFPKWLHRDLPQTNTLWETQGILGTHRLPTVCEEAKCPNLLECWSKKTATFLAMGSACTRACGFCDIDFAANPKPLEVDEPERIAKSVLELGLKHVVITMVARDDIADGGASHLASIICAIRDLNPHATIEVLTSDFCGNEEALEVVLDVKPQIFNHNIETVRALSSRVRHKATYDRTLEVLHFVKKRGDGIKIKSGLMVGLGESEDQVKETIDDLHGVGCQIITIGQYLQANRNKLRVKSFITPEQFDSFAEYGHSIGVDYVFSGPFVRSSYNAAEVFKEVQ